MNACRIHPRGSEGFVVANCRIPAIPLLSEVRSPLAAAVAMFFLMRGVGLLVCALGWVFSSRAPVKPAPVVVRNSRRVGDDITRLVINCAFYAMVRCPS